MFNVTETDNRELWEHVVASLPQANFLQSFNWGDFHAALGKKVWRLIIWQDQQPVGVCLTVKESAKRGAYLTVAGGPVVIPGVDDAAYVAAFTFLKQLAKKEQAVFVRVRPQLMDSPQSRELFVGCGLQPAPMHLTADLTLQLDLTQTEDEILAQMRKSTRYEIRRAEKMGVKTEFSAKETDVKEFYEEQLAVAKRHNFVPFSYKFLHEQFKSFAKDNQVLLIKSSLDNNWLASAFVIFYGPEAVYHYGVSTQANAKLPGSYACQWEAIKEAKKRGIQRYNFWGIAPENQPNHRFAGVSLFKRGFGGNEVAYLPAHDLPVSWQYNLVKAFENWRRRSRKLG